MPLYEARLEATDGSGHFRVTRLQAADKKTAERQVRRLELRRVLYEISDEDAAAILDRVEEASGKRPDSIDELPKAAPLDASDEQKAAFRALDVADRARLHTHFQTEPYELVSIEAVSK